MLKKKPMLTVLLISLRLKLLKWRHLNQQNKFKKCLNVLRKMLFSNQNLKRLKFKKKNLFKSQISLWVASLPAIKEAKS
jgi:hypothetical protein